MAMRWIGEAARELGIEVWEAIALLSKEDTYPMNGLLDDERFQLLRHATGKKVETSGSSARPRPPVPPPPPRYRDESTAVTSPPSPPLPPPEGTSVTAAMPPMPDRSEAKTVIYPSEG